MANHRRPAVRVPARFAALFQPGAIGKLVVKNRLVMPSMVRNYADAQGRATDRYVAHISRVARGGVGAIILEASYVRPEGRGFLNELGIHEDAVIPGLKLIVSAAHKHGAAIGIQLYHGGRQASSRTSGLRPVAPSAIPEPTVREMPKELSVRGVREIVRAFGDAAARAEVAGLDFVELHGAHGYLINQFLSPFSNKRRDAYGGTPEKRLRFLLEVHAEVRRRVSPGFPVMLRLSAEEFVPGGLTIKDTLAIAKRMEKEGIAAVHVSSSNYASYAKGLLIPPMAVPEGPLVKYAARFKKALRIPVVAVAKLRDPAVDARLVKDGKADFIAVGRSLLADPDWPIKVMEGRVKDIRPCVACNQGCISRLFAQEDVWCTVNPENGREREFAMPAKEKRRVFVVGGGPAGLTAAVVAAERGHAVTLFEKERSLGGQLAAAAAAPYRGDWALLREWLIARVKSLPIEVRLRREFRPADALREVPDVLIVAVGSAPTRPHLPGADLPNVVTARALLEGKVRAKGRVVMAGGGCMGAQTAEFLADRGRPVTIVEMSGEVAAESPVDDRALLLARLARKKVKIVTNTRIAAIEPGAVVVGDGKAKRRLPADTVVLCLGAKPNDSMIAEVEGVIPKTVIVGDAVEPRRVTEAVAEAALAAIAI